MESRKIFEDQKNIYIMKSKFSPGGDQNLEDVVVSEDGGEVERRDNLEPGGGRVVQLGVEVDSAELHQSLHHIYNIHNIVTSA